MHHTLLLLRPLSLRHYGGLLVRLGLEVGLDLPAVPVARPDGLGLLGGRRPPTVLLLEAPLPRHDRLLRAPERRAVLGLLIFPEIFDFTLNANS